MYKTGGARLTPTSSRADRRSNRGWNPRTTARSYGNVTAGLRTPQRAPLHWPRFGPPRDGSRKPPPNFLSNSELQLILAEAQTRSNADQEPRAIGQIPTFTCSKEAWNTSAPRDDIRVISMNEETVTYTYESFSGPTATAQGRSTHDQQPRQVRSPVDEAVAAPDSAVGFLMLREHQQRQYQQQQQRQQERQQRQQQTLLREQLASKLASQFETTVPPPEPPPPPPPPPPPLSPPESQPQLLTPQALQQQQQQQHVTSPQGAAKLSGLDVQGKALSLQETVLEVVKLAKERSVAEAENRQLRSSLEVTKFELDKNAASEHDLMTMLQDSQKEIELLQQLQMESNRLNTALMVQLNTMRAQEAALADRRRQEAGVVSNSERLNEVLQSEWKQQQQTRDLSRQQASVAMAHAAQAAIAARSAMASAAENAATAAAASAREVARLRLSNAAAEQEDGSDVTQDGTRDANSTFGGASDVTAASTDVTAASPTSISDEEAPPPTGGGGGGGGASGGAAAAAAAPATLAPAADADADTSTAAQQEPQQRLAT